MNWNAVQLDAKAKGILIFGINQSQTAPLTEPGPWGAVQGGFCLGLCCTWMAMAYQGKSFPVAGDVCNDPPWQATLSHNTELASPASWADWWAGSLQPFQCTLSDGLRATRPTKPTASFLWSVMSHAYGCYAVSLNGSAGAHAIALRHGRDGRYHLFDPNNFHVAVKGIDAFKSFLTNFVAATGYDSQYATQTGIVGVVPPIA